MLWSELLWSDVVVEDIVKKNRRSIYEELYMYIVVDEDLGLVLDPGCVMSWTS